MFNFRSENIIVLFAPLSRGNFVKNCLTLASNTADHSYKDTTLQFRMKWYKKHIVNPVLSQHPWGPGHCDAYKNFDLQRFKYTESSECYVHCAHLSQVPWTKKQNCMVENIPLPNKKYVVITLNKNNVSTIRNRCKDINLLFNDEADFFCNTDKINNFLQQEWYNMPYDNILNKNLFLKDCKNINTRCNIDCVLKYYNEYTYEQ